MANNQQINGTDYYALPDGTQLEDAMFDRRLNGPEWSGVKYLYRAGKKDEAKAWHFAEFLARRRFCPSGAAEQMERFRLILTGIIAEHSKRVVATKGCPNAY